MKAGSAPATVRQELKKIQAAWSWGREMGLCPARDLSRVRVSGIGVRNKRTPTVGEVARVLAVMDGWPHLAIYLLYSTAGRPVDVAYLRWRDVELELAQVTLRGKKKERQIPLDLEVVQALKTWGVGGPDDLVLGVSPKMVLGHLSSRYLAKACKTAGVHRFTPYGLRRCGEDRLARAGVDVAVYAAILGHSPAVALKHYRRATMDDCRAAMKRAALSHLPSGDVLPFAQGGRDR